MSDKIISEGASEFAAQGTSLRERLVAQSVTKEGERDYTDVGTGENPQLTEQPDLPRHMRINKRGPHIPIDGVLKMKHMSFDPLAAQINLYREISKEIDELQRLKVQPYLYRDGSTRRYSAMHHAQLLALQQKIGADLMRYGYMRVPENINQDTTPEIPRPVIMLTPKGGQYNHSRFDDEPPEVSPIEYIEAVTNRDRSR